MTPLAARVSYPLPPDLSLEIVAAELAQLRAPGGRRIAAPNEDPKSVIARTILWQRLADVGLIRLSLSVVDAPIALRRADTDTIAHLLRDRCYPRRTALAMARRIAQQILADPNLAWVDRLSLAGDIVDSKDDLVDTVVLLYAPAGRPDITVSEKTYLIETIRRITAEPRYAEMFALRPFASPGDPVLSTHDLIVDCRSHEQVSIVARPVSARGKPVSGSLRRPKITEPIAAHTLNPMSIVRLQPDAKGRWHNINLLINPSANDRQNEHTSKFKTIKGIEDLDGREQFGLCWIGIDEKTGKPDNSPATLNVRRFIQASADAVTYVMLLEPNPNSGGPRTLAERLDFIEYLAALMFCDLAVLKARCESADIDPTINLRISGMTAESREIAFGIRVMSRTFSTWFAEQGQIESVKLVLPSIPADPSESERVILQALKI